MAEIIHQYPPELMQLLIEAIPLRCRSKPDVVLFFRGAGVAGQNMSNFEERLRKDRNSVRKHEIVRTILTRLNDRGDASLRERREILKRVVEFEDFTTCWPEDRLKAENLVARVRQIVNVKDSFTRMNQEREKAAMAQTAVKAREGDERQKQMQALARIRDELFALFSETDAQKRGKALEPVLNRLFKASGILMREAFTLTGSDGHGIVEQIDGVIAVGEKPYLVEMKWHKDALGVDKVTQHISRLYLRADVGGIIVSASGYTEAAIDTCRQALSQKVVVLVELREIVRALERQMDLRAFFKAKINAASIYKQPLHDPFAES